jgi:hypothetical protein
MDNRNSELSATQRYLDELLTAAEKRTANSIGKADPQTRASLVGAQIQAGAALFAAEIMARAVYDQSNSTMQAASLIGMAARELGESIVQAGD